jgi:hypothetical protein
VSTPSTTEHSTRPLGGEHSPACGRPLVDERAFVWIARSGFVARAIVYGGIGVLAFEVAGRGALPQDLSAQRATTVKKSRL